jgi:hypothetical protein
LIFEWTLIIFTVYKEFTYKNVENQNMELSIKFRNTIVGQIVIITTERGLALAVIHPNTDCARHCLTSNIIISIPSFFLFIYFYYCLKNLLHSLGLVLQIYEGHDDQLNRPGPMA